jgi:hypothetical protein
MTRGVYREVHCSGERNSSRVTLGAVSGNSVFKGLRLILLDDFHLEHI